MPVEPGRGLVEVGDRCLAARRAVRDVTVGAVAGERGVVVVDTGACEPEARMVVEELRRLRLGEVVAVVNTHHHFDHVLGNAVLREEYGGPRLLAHEAAVAAMPEATRRAQAEAARDADPRSAEVAAARLLVPDETLHSVSVVDLGDRFVEVVHPGRGHTAGDLVVRVPDADVLFAGDLVFAGDGVEEAASRQGVSGFGYDCFPLEWPEALDLVLTLLGDRSVVVPGHGRPVGRRFVEEQRCDIAEVAATIRRLAGQGVPVGEALAAAEWPYPAQELAAAVERGYRQLPPTVRTLPLV